MATTVHLMRKQRFNFAERVRVVTLSAASPNPTRCGIAPVRGTRCLAAAVMSLVPHSFLGMPPPFRSRTIKPHAEGAWGAPKRSTRDDEAGALFLRTTTQVLGEFVQCLLIDTTLEFNY